VRTSRRRRTDAALLAGGSLLVGGAALLGALAGDPERVTRYWAAAEVGDDGSARVVEVIDYSFGGFASDRHGIFRWIPGLSPAADVTVESDAPDAVEATEETRQAMDGTPVGGANFRIGDPDTTVSGRHRYRIGYELPDVRRGDTVDWEAVGAAWEVGMDEVEVHLVMPFELEDAVCVQGPVGSTAPCDVRQGEPGHVVAAVDGLGAGEGVSIEGRVGAAVGVPPAMPPPPAEAPDDPGTGVLPPAGTAAAAAAVAAVPTTVLVRRAGRERVAAGGAADAAFGGGARDGDGASAGDGDSASTAAPTAAGTSPATSVPPPPPVPGADRGAVPASGDRSPAAPAALATAPPAATERRGAGAGEIRVDAADLAEMATTEFAPPAGLTPPQGGIVLHEQVRNEHKVAWLIQAAIDGAIDIDDTGGTTTIRRLPGGPASDGQRAVFDPMFARGDEIELGSYDRHFATAWAFVGRELDDWRETSELWDRAADRRKIATRALGVVAVLAGLVVAALGGVAAGRLGAPWLVVVLTGGALAGGGLAAALGAWELHVRTPAGSAAWLRTESFRRFLAGSEAYHAEQAAQRGVLREYTAWALAVGEIDRWASAVRASTIAPDVAGVHYAYMAPVLLSSTTSTATQPSSSGSGGGGLGGFGGGSVGGGAGGGGGGSW
jgi:Predicted membrane protein (DUF2207)